MTTNQFVIVNVTWYPNHDTLWEDDATSTYYFRNFDEAEKWVKEYYDVIFDDKEITTVKNKFGYYQISGFARGFDGVQS